MKRQQLQHFVTMTNSNDPTESDNGNQQVAGNNLLLPINPGLCHSQPEAAICQFAALLGGHSIQGLSDAESQPALGHIGAASLPEYLADDDADLQTVAICSFPSLSISSVDPLYSFSCDSRCKIGYDQSSAFITPTHNSNLSELERSASLKLSRRLHATRYDISEVPATIVENVRESLSSMIDARLRRCIVLLRGKKIGVQRNSMRAKLLHNIAKTMTIPNIVTSFHVSLDGGLAQKMSKDEQESSSKISVPVTFHAVADIAFGEQNVLSVILASPGNITGKYPL
uniref:Uncharacterized protein n=1 Tax=Corethron hystrix TaxID=216773 RepID=A0A7S1FL92_9STRA|mmetsp:Transcript_13219/g.29133  ORF Transcript_13219/g.29133 Transcript_13219/m.29133 type:complete len:285 (+) Transcript_13219:99-953(+)